MANETVSPSTGGNFGLIGGTLTGLADLANSISGMVANSKNYKLSKEAFEFNKNMANWNKDFSERQFQYSKDLQQQIFGREDNAVQRRVADLEGAGFNKLLSLGQAANAGSPVAAGGSGVQSNVSPARMDNPVNLKVKDSLEAMNLCWNAMKMKQDIAQSKTQEDKIRSDIKVNDSQANLNNSVAKNKDVDTEYYEQRKKESNSNISRNSSYINHLNYQNEFIQEKANESRATQDAIDMKILQDYFDYNMYRGLNLPSGSLHYQGKNNLRSWFLRGAMNVGSVVGGSLAGDDVGYNRRRSRGYK